MKKDFSILYAEDDIDSRKNYVSYLKKYFEEIYEAEDGLAALNIYNDKKPDIVLLDITMPYLNGLEVAQSIRKKDTTTPIIILSAHSHKEYLFEAIKLNLVDYLIKPINRVEFKEVIQKTIAQLGEYENIEDRIEISEKSFWDRKARLYFYDNKLIDLTKNERILFELLIENKNMIVEPKRIISQVWEDKDNSISDASLRNLVKRLRKKLPEDIVQSMYGSGYIINF